MTLYYLHFFIFFLNSIVVFYNKIYLKQFLFTCFYFSYQILVVLGSIYIYYPELILYENNDFYSSNFTIVLFLIQALFFVSTLLLSSSHTINKFSFANQEKHHFITRLPILIIISASIVLFDLISNGPPVFYKFFSSGLSNNELVTLRTESISNQNFFFINQTGYYLIPLIVSLILHKQYLIKKTAHSKIKYIISLIISSLLALSFMHKGPLIILWTSIFINFLIHKNFNLSSSYYFKIFFTLLILVFLQYVLVFRNQTFDSYVVLKSISQRIFGVYSIQLAVLVKFIETEGFMYLSTIPNFGGLIIGHTPFDLSRKIYEIMFFADGNAPPPSIGYGYAALGFLGVFINFLITTFC